MASRSAVQDVTASIIAVCHQGHPPERRDPLAEHDVADQQHHRERAEGQIAAAHTRSTSRATRSTFASSSGPLTSSR